MNQVFRMAFGLFLVVLFGSNMATAQITTPRVISEPANRTATLEEQLVNRLRAVTVEQRNYIALIIEQVELKKLDVKLVVAIERYALRRNPQFPFPFFERAIRYEAAKRGVSLPTVEQFSSNLDSRIPSL